MNYEEAKKLYAVLTREAEGIEELLANSSDQFRLSVELTGRTCTVYMGISPEDQLQLIRKRQQEVAAQLSTLGSQLLKAQRALAQVFDTFEPPFNSK